MKTDIHEYAEEMSVEINQLSPEPKAWESVITKETYEAHLRSKWVIKALNEAGYNQTLVDLEDVLKFVKKNMPDLWNSI